MEFLRNFFGTFLTGPQQRYYGFQVKCKRCGEMIEGNIDTANELSVEYEGNNEVFYVRKVLMGDGSNRCYQKIEVGMKFNKGRRLLEKRIEGGEFVE